MSFSGDTNALKKPQAKPMKVAFVDNGFLQRKIPGEQLKGGLLIQALQKHFGGNEVSIGAAPFLWLELAGNRKFAVERIDQLCKSLPPPNNAKEIQFWLEESLRTITDDQANIGQEIIEETKRGLLNTLQYFTPHLRDMLSVMWNEGQRDCSYHSTLMQHLAIDRLAVRLSRKHSAVTRTDSVEVGGQIISFVARFLKTNPGISPYRMLLLSWEPVYNRKMLEIGINHELSEKSDLLDGDLVSRSVLKLSERFESPLIMTADDEDEFKSRRNHLVSACLYINEKIKEMKLVGPDYSPLKLTDSTVCHVKNNNTYFFARQNNPNINF